ncbi:MAG: hypothetical protein D6744_18940 [Planctomycetota bacterium]|nr:MAG: hypothetical protein D6744_18940 [Planctomycetota bacterium]
MCDATLARPSDCGYTTLRSDAAKVVVMAHESSFCRRSLRGGLFVLSAVPALLTVGACDRPRPPHKYVALSGTVAACHPQTGELTVRLTDPSSRRARDDQLECVVTSDSEIYINDMFSTLDRVQIGDRIELVGYRDASRPIESFVVSFAYCEHTAPTPAVPPLLQPPASPASAPASAPRSARLPRSHHEQSADSIRRRP